MKPSVPTSKSANPALTIPIILGIVILVIVCMVVNNRIRQKQIDAQAAPLLQQGKQLVKAGRLLEAKSAYLGIVQRFPDSSLFHDAEEGLYFVNTEIAKTAPARSAVSSATTPVGGVSPENAELIKIAELITKAEGGDVKAQYQLARAYETGSDVSKNEEEALRWYTKSAEQGYAKAQYEVGGHYYWSYFHTHLASDGAKAAYWLGESGKNGNADAQYLIGKMYWFGQGVSEDLREGNYWMCKAAAQGHKEAYALMDKSSYDCSAK